MFDTLLYRPRTSGRFSTLMELYEANYLQMRLLAPELQRMRGDRFVSAPQGALPLELTALEHERFTTTFNLSYCFSSERRLAREPDLAIRLYHDARTCEVMSGLMPSSTHESRRVRDLMDGYRLNRFLSRWLGYCLRQGHRFDVIAGNRAGDVDQPPKELLRCE